MFSSFQLSAKPFQISQDYWYEFLFCRVFSNIFIFIVQALGSSQISTDVKISKSDGSGWFTAFGVNELTPAKSAMGSSVAAETATHIERSILSE